MKKYDDILKGGDLRSMGKANRIVKEINVQSDLDALFKGLFHTDRIVVMRTADVIEKITLTKPGFLKRHKKEILGLCFNAKHIELKWHLALLVARLKLTPNETRKVWQLLKDWAINEKESKIVRVNSVQGLFNILQENKEFEQDFNQMIKEIGKENIASLNARIRKIKAISANKAFRNEGDTKRSLC